MTLLQSQLLKEQLCVFFAKKLPHSYSNESTGCKREKEGGEDMEQFKKPLHSLQNLPLPSAHFESILLQCKLRAICISDFFLIKNLKIFASELKTVLEFS